MRMCNLFTIPEGEKVTEKAFTRVLVFSVCSILLCMGCLVGATWAWFAADVESSDNVIAIATATVDTTVSRDGAAVEAAADGSYRLSAGAYALQMKLNNNAADSQRALYVLMTVQQDGEAQRYYLTFQQGQTDKTLDLTVSGTDATVAFRVFWTVPETAVEWDGAVTLIGHEPTESTTATTATTTTTTTGETTTTVAETTTTTTVEEETTTTAETTTTVTEETTTTTTVAEEITE